MPLAHSLLLARPGEPAADPAQRSAQHIHVDRLPDERTHPELARVLRCLAVARQQHNRDPRERTVAQLERI